MQLIREPGCNGRILISNCLATSATEDEIAAEMAGATTVNVAGAAQRKSRHRIRFFLLVLAGLDGCCELGTKFLDVIVSGHRQLL